MYSSSKSDFSENIINSDLEYNIENIRISRQSFDIFYK